MPDDLIRRSDAKAAIDYANCEKSGFTKGAAKAAIDSVPAADGRNLLAPDEVKAVLAEALSSQPMAKVWAEAAINAMCGITVADAPTGEGEKPPRPPMVLATFGDWEAMWWMRSKYDPPVWESAVFAVRANDIEVDRTASDPEALKLYDADLTSRPGAAKE